MFRCGVFKSVRGSAVGTLVVRFGRGLLLTGFLAFFVGRCTVLHGFVSIEAFTCSRKDVCHGSTRCWDVLFSI